MGLGKTLSLLALVCSSLDSLANQEGSPNDGISRSTLIVTPKSSMSQIPVIIIETSLSMSSDPWMAETSRKVPDSGRSVRVAWC